MLTSAFSKSNLLAYSRRYFSGAAMHAAEKSSTFHASDLEVHPV